MRGRAVSVVACGALLAGSLLAQCTETRRGIGETCLKGDDCLSGICAGQQCVAAPPLLDGEPPVPAEAGPEGGDAVVEAAPDTRPADSSPPDVNVNDGGVDAPAG